MMNLHAAGALFLSVFLMGCAGQAERPPPIPVKIRELVPVPAWCFQLEPVSLPPNSTSDDVEAEQHRALLAYEARMVSCAEVNKPRAATPPAQ